MTIPISTRDGWTLQTEQGEPVHVGQQFTDHHGNADRITGGTPPRRPGTSGYVSTEAGEEFYPGVFSLRWVSPEGRYFGDGQ